MKKNIRAATKAGNWYPADRDELSTLINSFVDNSKLSMNMKTILAKPCQAAITPHAGIFFSGECAAKAYYAMSQKNPTPKTIIVFGATHNYTIYSAGVWNNGLWQTPLGDIEVDVELAQELIKTSCAEADCSSHLTDNSIELQTPFIKYFFPDSMILPISTPPTDDSEAIGRAVATITASAPEDYLVIGSSDLTHYGSAYGFTPAGEGLEGIDWARANDIKLIKLIETLQTDRIIPEVTHNHSACGSGALTATVSFAASRNIDKGITLEHILSHDIMPTDPPEMSVGYASIIF